MNSPEGETVRAAGSRALQLDSPLRTSVPRQLDKAISGDPAAELGAPTTFGDVPCPSTIRAYYSPRGLPQFEVSRACVEVLLGFGDNFVAAGSGVMLTVGAAIDATVNLTIRCANALADAVRTVVVDGQMVATPTFASTGSWNNWSTVTVPVQLRDGLHSVVVGSNPASLVLPSSPTSAPDSAGREYAARTCDGCHRTAICTQPYRWD